MRPFHSMLKKSLALILFGFIASCMKHYYNPTPVQRSDYAKQMEKAIKKHHFIYLKSGINLYQVMSLDTDRAKDDVTVTLHQVDSTHQYYFKNPYDRRTRSKESNWPNKPELKIYLQDSSSYTLDEPHTIPIARIDSIVSWK